MSTLTHTPSYWQRAVQELSCQDAIMKGLISQYPGETLKGKNDPYLTLARAIVGQQISVKAADAIWNRLEATCDLITPELILKEPDEQLRLMGLSQQKTHYLKNIAQYFLDKNITKDHWRKTSPEAVVQDLIALKGIGRWTIDMFNIFHLLHPDILPLSDVGLIKAIQRAYGQQMPLSCNDIILLSEQWRPWRTVATWYLWRSLDPIPVEY